MRWRPKWGALSARIEALTKAGELLATTRPGDRDILSVQGRVLMPEMIAIRNEVTAFAGAHRADLPSDAFAALDRFMTSPLFKEDSNEIWGATLVVHFAVLRAEFDYLIRDQQQEARSLTELAFEHLRRSIAVDEDVRRKWKAAFADGEVACERLGAVHLLSHGIWAFKVEGQGEATDLVFGDAIEHHESEIERTARALVATEWKLVKTPAHVEAKAAEARAQLKRYERGVLGDLALTSTRFVVLVGDKTLPGQENKNNEGITYRHIVLATDPETPSEWSRSAAGRQST